VRVSVETTCEKPNRGHRGGRGAVDETNSTKQVFTGDGRGSEAGRQKESEVE